MKTISTVLICSLLCLSGHTQTLNSLLIKKFNAGMKFKRLTSDFAKGSSYALMERALFNVEKTEPTNSAVLAAFETFEAHPKVSENFFFEAVLSQKGNTENARQVLYSLSGEMQVSISIVDFILSKYKSYFADLSMRLKKEKEKKEQEEEQKAKDEEAKREIERDRQYQPIGDSVRNDTILPRFSGGKAMLYKYIERNIDADVAALNNVQGVVKVAVLIDKNGEIKSVKALNSPGGGLAEEAERVLKQMPPFWRPAKYKQIAVDCNVVIPINFSLN